MTARVIGYGDANWKIERVHFYVYGCLYTECYQAVCYQVMHYHLSSQAIIEIGPKSGFSARCYTQSAVMPQYVVSLSICPSVCIALLDFDHSWYSSNIISRLDSLSCSLSADPNTVNTIDLLQTPTS